METDPLTARNRAEKKRPPDKMQHALGRRSIFARWKRAICIKSGCNGICVYFRVRGRGRGCGGGANERFWTECDSVNMQTTGHPPAIRRIDCITAANLETERWGSGRSNIFCSGQLTGSISILCRPVAQSFAFFFFLFFSPDNSLGVACSPVSCNRNGRTRQLETKRRRRSRTLRTDSAPLVRASAVRMSFSWFIRRCRLSVARIGAVVAVWSQPSVVVVPCHRWPCVFLKTKKEKN